MRFADIKGHASTIEALRQMADTGRIPHAIMLGGQPGIGKMRLARAFAQYVHCSHRSGGDSCGVCPSCLQHQSLNNPDMHYIFPVIKQKSSGRAVSSDYMEEWREMLDTDSYMDPSIWLSTIDAGNSQPKIFVHEADDINAAASLSAFSEDYKIFLIWLPEKMQPEAANKLLKLIEEPFPDTIFLLVSNDTGSVLPTVFSRAQRFNLRKLTELEIADAAAEVAGADMARATSAAMLAEGSVSKALALLKDSADIEDFSNLFKAVMRGAYARRIALLRQLADKAAAMGREKLVRWLRYSSHLVRENFVFNLHCRQLNILTPQEREFSEKFAPFIHEGNVEKMLSEFSMAERDVARNANSKLVMFSLFLTLCALIRTSQRPQA